MSHPLHPRILDTLDLFARRRRGLLLARGGLILAAFALVLLIVLALLDRARLVPDGLRPWLSLVAYGVALAAAWKQALHLLKHWRDPLNNARLIEASSPGTSETILSVVELAQAKEAQGSPEFLQRLHESAAEDAARFQVEGALPTSSLKPWALRLGGIAVGIVILSCIPTLHLAGFLVRAAIPFVPMDRPAMVEIEILAPSPADSMAPFVSDVEVAVEVVGPLPKRVSMEIEQADSSRRIIELQHRGDQRFYGTLSIGQLDVDYRFRAADALTRWHRISARPRPAIESFVKTLTPPAYIGGEPQVIEDDHGDIEAIEGTKVQLSLRSNQALREGSVWLNPDTGDAHEVAESALVKSKVLEGNWILTPDLHSWKPRLISKGTGFSNDEANPWRLISIPDLPPLARLSRPIGQIAAMPDETVRVSGTASDDIGLKSIELATAVDGTNWTRVSLPPEEWSSSSDGAAATSSVFSRPLPLGKLSLGVGEVVLVKWIAKDLKDQEAESDVLRIAILERIVDPGERRWARSQSSLARLSDRLKDEINAASEAVRTLTKNRNRPDTDQTAAARTEIAAALDRVEGTTEELWNEVKRAAREAPGPMEQREADLLGRQAANLREALVPDLATELGSEKPDADATAKAASAIIRTASSLREAARTFAAEATSEIARKATEHLERQMQLHTQQALEANRDPAQRPKWQERQRAAAQSAIQVIEDLEAARAFVRSGGQQRSLEQSEEAILEAAQDLLASLDQENQMKSPEHLYGATDHLRQRLTRARDTTSSIINAEAAQAAKLRENLGRQLDPALAQLNEARAELLKAANTVKQRTPEELAEAKETAKDKLEAASRLLEAEADLASQSPLAPSPLASEKSRAARAAEKLARDAESIKQPAAPDEATAEAMKAVAANTDRLAKAAQSLDAAELAQKAAEAVFEAGRKLDEPDPQGTAPDPKKRAQAAAAAAEELKQARYDLQKLQEQDSAEKAGKASAEAQAAANQLKNRPTKDQGSKEKANSQASEQVAKAQKAISDLASSMGAMSEAARVALDELTPAMSEMMKSLAKDLQGSGNEASKAAAQAEDSAPVEEVAKQASALQPEASENARRMESLQSALRHEANQADLTEMDERQLSRAADVALAQMRNQAPEIKNELRNAAQAQQRAPQQQSLQNAANMQQQTAQALQELAQHFEHMESGGQLTAEQLASLSEMEQSLGVQEALDSAYERVQDLADLEAMAQEDPNRALAALERELPTNPVMQNALAQIARQSAQNAETSMVEGSKQPAMMGLAAELASHEIERIARHQERLGQQSAAEKAAAASQTLQETAQATKGQPAKATPQQGQQAAEAAAQAAKAASDTAATMAPSATANPLVQLQGLMLAQALDQIDQQLNPIQSGQPGEQQQGQQGQPSQQQQQQQSAQQSLSDAQQSQQQSMAQARNQGQVPGSKSQDQQMAQADSPSDTEDPSQTNNSGNFDGPLEDGGILADALLLEGGGLEWGQLPARTAEDLSEATRREAAPEYRAAIESYYNAIAKRAREP